MGHMGAPWLDRKSREIEERPDLVINALGLNSSDVVADFGAGSGYFTEKIAPLCSLVYAVDIQREMIDINLRKMKSKGITNVNFILGAEKITNLPKESIDYLIMVDVYHELEFPYEIMQDIYRAMKQNGNIVLVEYRKEDPKVMIKPLHKMSINQIRKEMKNSGFELNRSFKALPRQHMLFFIKKAAF
jgi:ubiquinone/menaquinone biosynthesis C-methylase UbiE